MIFALHLVKCFVFGFNMACLILGIGLISVSSLGLENAKPNTDEHTYFIVGILLGSLIGMTTLFGCYGVVSELLGVNIIYTIFILVLLALQYLQMRSFQPYTFYRHTLERLEDAWQQMISTNGTQSMEVMEKNYQCCGLFNFRDYNYIDVDLPLSCYRHSDHPTLSNLYRDGCIEAIKGFYQSAINRNRIFTWALVVAEILASVYAIGFSVILYRLKFRRGYEALPEQAIVVPIANHIGSRTHLLID